jgi:hypothetical protein
MPIKEVNSPVNTGNARSKLASGQPLSPGAKSNPSRARGDQAEPTERPAAMTRGGEKPAELRGAEDRRR